VTTWLYHPLGENSRNSAHYGFSVGGITEPAEMPNSTALKTASMGESGSKLLSRRQEGKENQFQPETSKQQKG
jgi:hypothetical protein